MEQCLSISNNYILNTFSCWLLNQNLNIEVYRRIAIQLALNKVIFQLLKLFKK